MAKERELTEQQKIFLDQLFGDADGNFRVAMRAAGYSDNTTRAEIIKTLGEEIVSMANGALALQAPKAVRKFEYVLDNPNAPGNPNLLKAAAEILNRVGVQKAAGSVDLKVPSGGLVILPAKGSFTDEDGA
jgi:hypothetical protein